MRNIHGEHESSTKHNINGGRDQLDGLMNRIDSMESIGLDHQTLTSLEWRRFLHPKSNISRELSWGNELTIPRMANRNHPQQATIDWHSLFKPNGKY